ncbi:MAG TPA: response regulator [Bdellovibrionota bacterium]|jgi:DNA-binding NtrC family response regulator
MSGVLLVTADKEVSRLVKLAIRDTPARLTHEAHTATTAIEAFAQLSPRIVIVDLFLPESSGLDVLSRLHKVSDKCIFILLTRIQTRDTLERAFRMGAHDVLAYPLKIETLKDTILHRLSAQPMQEDLEESDPTAR